MSHEDKFTDRARKVMQLARAEAQRFNHEYVGTEHILLGIAKEFHGAAANILRIGGVDLRKLRNDVERLAPTGPEMVTMGKLPTTPRAKQAIEFALEEARLQGVNFVGDHHLLLGLIREKEGVAGVLLASYGITEESVLKIIPRNANSPVFQAEATAPTAAMKLRDYFAGQAIQPIAATINAGCPLSPERVARSCYAIADAMMAERVKDAINVDS